MRRIVGALAAGAALCVSLSACSLFGEGVPGTTPVPSLTSGTASRTPTPLPTVPGANPTDPAADPDLGTGITPSSPPSAAPVMWSNEELLGACKVAWGETGRIAGWDSYSPDAVVEQNGDSWFVSIRSTASEPDRDCDVAGTPSSPHVSVRG